MAEKETVNIRPSVGYLSILQAINYRAWFAIAEFVDNSLQSYLQNKNQLRKIHGNNFKLKIAIYVSKSKIQIIDNELIFHDKKYNLRKCEIQISFVDILVLSQILKKLYLKKIVFVFVFK